MLSNAEAKRLRSLSRGRGRAETGLFLVEGVRGVEDLLASAVVPRLAVVAPSLEDTERGTRLAQRLRDTVQTLVAADHQLKSVAATEAPQGVVVAAEIPRYSLDVLDRGHRALVVLLDAVQDPGNFGTVVRSADAFGAAAVVTLPGTVDPWNPKSVRSAAGSSLRVPIIEAGVGEAFDRLRAQAYRVFGADMGGQDIATAPIADRVALVLGNEGAGLSDEVRPRVDYSVSVPIRGAAESLNVGVAAGILLYMLARER